MPHASPFVITVTDVLAEPSTRRPVTIEAAIDWPIGPSSVGPTITADLTVEGSAGGAMVRGTAASDAALSCHRCLTEWGQPVEVTVMEVFGVPDDPDGYPLVDGTIDLEPLLRDAVLLEVPLASTCKPGCLGLCSRCGGDLNTGGCAGHEDEVDSPFAVLRDLLEPQ